LEFLEGYDECFLCHVIGCLRTHSQAAHEHTEARLLQSDLLDEPMMI